MSTDQQRMGIGRRVLKVASTNIALFILGVGLLVTIPIVLVQSYELAGSIIPALDLGSTGALADRRAAPHELPNYRDSEWAYQHFEDLAQQKPMVKVQHLEWQNATLESETLNISATGIRRTNTSSIDFESTTSRDIWVSWMFGGSTMFGWGSDDNNTIPSILAMTLSAESINFGTPSYVVLQSLIRLISEYGALESAEDPPRLVVFLDGANDVQYMCRVEMPETLVRGYRSQKDRPVVTNKLEAPSLHKSLATSPRWLAQPFLTLINRFQDSGIVHSLNNNDDMYICDNQPKMAERVATAIVSDWMIAQSIAEQHGDRFVAMLQPVRYLSQSRQDHLLEFMYDKEWRKQFEAVYPIIRKKAEESGLNFLDVSYSLDQDEYYFIDAFHLSPAGNIRIVEDLVAYLSAGTHAASSE